MIEILDSTTEHVRELSKTIREKDKKEAIALGLIPHKGLFYSYRHAIYRKTGLVDGRVAAMWGVCGDILSSIGHPYLITGEELHKVPTKTFVKLYRKELLILKQFFPILENYVDSSYQEAIKLLRLSGFTLSETNNPELLKFCLTS